MHRDELKYSDETLTDVIWQGYAIKIKKMNFIDSGSFFGFIAELENYQKLFMKVYPKEKMVDSSSFSKEWLNEVGSALQRFRSEFGMEKLSFCISDKNNQFCYETDELLLLLFGHIEGFHPSYSPNLLSANKLAQIFYQLHHIPCSAFPNFKKEDFNIDYALGLADWISQNKFPKNPSFVKPMMSLLTLKKEILLNHLSELKEWQRKYLNQEFEQVITHGDPHHYNVLQTREDLWLVDWDGLKIAPRERDLWHYEDAPLIQEYRKLDPKFILNHELCIFYQRQRFFEDLRYYLDQVLLKANTTIEQDEKDIQSFLGHWGWKVCLKR